MICNILKDMGIEVKENFSLKDHISFKLDSIAALAVFPKNEKQLCNAVKIMRENGIRFVILGNGSNLFFAREYFDGAVVFTKGMRDMTVNENKINVLAGASFTSLALFALKNGLSGLEFAYGIPGTVGGAVYMNAGAYGGEVSDVLLSSRYYDMDTGEIKEIAHKEHDFGYRTSVYMKNDSLLCLGATFALDVGNCEKIKEKMNANMSARREKQPLELPNAGSYFKRPEGYFAGKLIEDCGLKGFSIGGAQVSEKHAGFIVNKGGATARDILLLEEEVRRRVHERFGVMLEREVRVIE